MYLHIQLDLIYIVIRFGASVNRQNPNNKYTPLHYAVYGHNIDAIRVLIDCGAKTNIRNVDVKF